jgi:hypothetical protein
MSLQIASDRFWAIAADQSRAAAVSAGLRSMMSATLATEMASVILLVDTPLHSLLSMPRTSLSLDKLRAASLSPDPMAVLVAILTWSRRSFPQWDHSTPDACDCARVECLQSMTLRDVERVQANNAFLPANGTLSESLEFAQVGVMMVLR